MGFLDKAKKLAEQAQEKLDEVQKDFNAKQGTGGTQHAGPGTSVEYDKHGRPIQRETPQTPGDLPATQSADLAQPKGDPLSAGAPASPTPDVPKGDPLSAEPTAPAAPTPESPAAEPTLADSPTAPDPTAAPPQAEPSAAPAATPGQGDPLGSGPTPDPSAPGATEDDGPAKVEGDPLSTGEDASRHGAGADRPGFTSGDPLGG